jgi:hypothetical protein
MDSGTGLTLLGTALGSKNVVERILGPTADYLGGQMLAWTERSVRNVGRVFESARRKLGDKLEAPGAVPPRVLKGVLQEGPFCDDELAAEYFGGVLASSRSQIGRDDRGATFTALVGRLSTYQIRTHFLFYSLIRILYGGSSENIAMPEGRNRLQTFVPITGYFTAMEFRKGEDAWGILSHVMFGLSREALIEDNFLFGGPEALRSRFAGAGLPGILFLPSGLGVELFLWAHGRGDLRVPDILNPAVQLTPNAQVEIPSGVRSTSFPDRTFPSDLTAPQPGG